MRYVAGDLRSLVREEGGSTRPGRADRRQVAAALDAAHAAGLVTATSSPPTYCWRRATRLPVGLRAHASTRSRWRRDAFRSLGGDARLRRAGADPRRAGRRARRRLRLGCVLYFALTGAAPFPRDGDEAKLWAHLTRAAAGRERARRGPAAGSRRGIARAMAKRPADRYPRRATSAARRSRPPARGGPRARARGRRRRCRSGRDADGERDTRRSARGPRPRPRRSRSGPRRGGHLWRRARRGRRGCDGRRSRSC